MSRMTLQQWQDKNKRSPSKASVITALTKAIKRKMLADGVIQRKPKKEKLTWDFQYGNHSGQVKAHTRSEAKAEIKNVYGIKKLTLALVLKVHDDTAIVGAA